MKPVAEGHYSEMDSTTRRAIVDRLEPVVDAMGQFQDASGLVGDDPDAIPAVSVADDIDHVLDHFVAMTARRYTTTAGELARGCDVPIGPQPGDKFCDIVGRAFATADPATVRDVADAPPLHLKPRDNTLECARIAARLYRDTLDVSITRFLDATESLDDALVVAASDGRSTIRSLAADVGLDDDQVREALPDDMFEVTGDMVRLTPDGQRRAAGLLHEHSRELWGSAAALASA